MPVKGSSKANKLSARAKASFSPDEAVRLRQEAKACGMTQAKYIRAAVLGGWGEVQKPKRRKYRQADQLVHEISLLNLQLKKLGTNVNQLARQANTGLVAVTRSEAEYLMNRVQVTTAHTAATMEKLLA